MTVSDLPGPPLIRTKLLAPVEREPIDRPAAMRVLRAPGPRRLTLIRAPAGWGKSSLLATWSAADPRQFAWVALDRLDSAPVRFFSYLIAALNGLVPAVGGRSLPVLLARGRLKEEVLPALLDELAHLPEPAVLVLDDYHLVHAEEVHEALEFLLAHLPPGLELAIATRTEPPFPLARLRARGELAEVTADELRFTPEEAQELLDRGQGLSLDAADVERLVERTEGWPAGLYLAGLSLRGREDAGAAVARFAGDDRHVVDYLTDEVLAGEPGDVREFLLDTCILERLCAPLCDAVTGRNDGAATLRRIEASNLFLVPLDRQREWYRYHHLFADLLQLEARGRDTAEAHRRAADWHLEHGLLTDAIRHRTAAGDHATAAETIARHWLLTLTMGSHDAVGRWLDWLPDEVVRADARLAAARAMCLISSGRIDRIAEWIQAVERAEMGGPSYDGFTVPRTTAAHLRSIHCWLVGDVGGSLAAATAALGHEGPRTGWDAVTLMFSGGARYWLGETERGRAEVEEALAGAREAGFHPTVISGLGVLAIMEQFSGDYGGARARAEEAIELTERHGLSEFQTSASAHTVLGEVLLAEGDADAARRELDRGLELSRRGLGPIGTARALVACARVAPPDERRELLGEARRLIEHCPDPGQRAFDMLAEAERWTGAARRAVVALGEPFSDRELEVLRMLSGPLSQREIGSELFISFNTVKSHTKAIYRKLGAAGRDDAVARARELRLI